MEPPFGKSVVFVGVDSLSKTSFDRAGREMPALHDLLHSSRVYERAYTPLGRTYPAWISILSGRTPQETGAICNLRNMEVVATNDLLSSRLQQDGFKTVFAIDERRFNNMGESFGFDRVIGPKVGVLDFVLQNFSDNPLSNLALQFGLAKLLYPYSYINSASYVNYSDVGFVNSVLSAVDGGGKVFLAVHFESAHFPYKTRHSAIKVKSDNTFWSQHAEALSAVDKQVAMLMSGLKDKGMLDDALVVLLSDHGEGLGDVERTLNVDGQAQDIVGYGHGVNLLSDAQNRVVLGTLVFRHGKVVNQASEDRQQVSLADIRAGVERYLQGEDPVLSSQSACMIVETGIRFSAAANYKTLNEAELAEQSASFYEVTGMGLLQLRESRLAELVRGKDVGLRCQDRLTYYSVERSGYLAFDLDSKGLPVRQVAPLDQDVQVIESYRRKYKDQYVEGL
ncbi:sulfatase-like hydrolase/transferase [Pseudomonas denitrificans (nom. rej.)]|uniref:sulfatase-like hydrolase/transferase n=1 Tax=Pseudomonas denitrificans TaxID=43306 RepID=UPI00142EC301|nr:sulfatase-like hydrolase/transferase [Pseudomonas denitrificans (nom. rej.)]